MGLPVSSGWNYRTLRSKLLIAVATLVLIEVVLRVGQPRILREDRFERSLTYSYDAELGWVPKPNSASIVTTRERTIHARHNSIGLRDIEIERDSRPVMLFLGDSMVWGSDAEADERFTDLLRSRITQYKTVNAGVSGFGTDQEYLWLQRIWPVVEPTVVVLTFCTANDRSDNSTNVRYGGNRKPYFATTADGRLELRGQPVPKSRQLYFKEDWLVHHSWLARFVITAYVEIRHRQRHVPDRTELLIDKIRDFVEARGARLVMGLEFNDDQLARHLQARQIPFVAFDGAETYSGSSGAHWTPSGHRLVADRLIKLLAENSIVEAARNPATP